MLHVAELETNGHHAALAEFAPIPVAASAGHRKCVPRARRTSRPTATLPRTMKRTSFWQRLNTATILLVLFLFVGVGFVFWAERRQADAQQRNESLDSLKHRIHKDLIQMSDALRGVLLDPNNKAERNVCAAAEHDLLSALRLVQGQFKEQAGLLQATAALRSLVSTNIGPFHTRVLVLLETDPAKAQAFYASNHEAATTLRDAQVRAFATEVDEAKSAESGEADRMIFLSLLGLGLLCVGMVLALLRQSAAIGRLLSELVTTLDNMRQGDFCHRIRWQRDDEFGVLGTGLDRLADDLSGLVGQVQRSGIQVNTCATEIAATARQQQTTAAAIAATTAEIGATSKEISATSKELVKTMNEVSEVAQETTEAANDGQNSIAQMEATMRQIMEASGGITAKLAVLSEKTTNINSVVTTITKVADQTNLLSLNAAIEAEKAGEYGLGFAVVAMEIRRLADQTAVATYDIEKMVKEMQSAVTAGVMGMDKFSEEVRRGAGEIRQVSAQLGRIIHEVQTLTPRFQIVNEGMQAQATGAEQISETLTHLGESAHQTAHSLRQSNASIEQLNDAARLLQTSVARFKLQAH